MKYGCAFRLSEIRVDVICFAIIALVAMHVQMTMVMPLERYQFLAETFIDQQLCSGDIVPWMRRNASWIEAFGY